MEEYLIEFDYYLNILFLLLFEIELNNMDHSQMNMLILKKELNLDSIRNREHGGTAQESALISGLGNLQSRRFNSQCNLLARR